MDERLQDFYPPRVYSWLPRWYLRASGVWGIVFGIGQFFLLRYLGR